MKKPRIGSRASRLALAQTDIVIAKLSALGLKEVEVVKITTTGDSDQRAPIEELGNKGVFVGEIESALIKGEIDIAVHSLKDLPARAPEGLKLAAFISPEDNRDVLISKGARLADIPAGAVIGTDSPRRRFQLQLINPDIKTASIRGNVETRIKKVRDGEYYGVILAVEGLRRLGLLHEITETIPVEKMVPAPGQGVIAVETRKNDEDLLGLIRKIGDPAQMIISELEREILSNLGAGCETPIGLSSKIENGVIETSIFLSTGHDNKYIAEVFKVDLREEDRVTGLLVGEIRGAWKALTGEEFVVN